VKTVFYILIVLAALSRVLPHPLNFTPIGALGLFAGAYAGKRWAWLVAPAALILGDLFIGVYNPVVMASVYIGFAAAGWLGRRFLRERRTAGRIAGTSVAQAAVFFVITNFSVWLAGYYPRTAQGLIQCYVMAVPLLANTLLGDLFYAAVLFGLYETAQSWAARRNGAAAAS
jgi:hypothetical protein